MAQMNVFENNAFELITMVDAFENIPYIPNYLEKDFEVKATSTRQVSIEEKDGVLTLIPFSERGSADTQTANGNRKLRYFDTVRLSDADTIYAHEIASIRAFGKESELDRVANVVKERGETRRNNINATLEYLRLGALQGKFMNPLDGSVMYNWFDEFDVTQPAEVSFDLANDGVLKKLKKERRRIIKESGGAVTPQTKVKMLCGSDFWDAFIEHPEIKETYLNWSAAQSYRDKEAGVYEEFTIGGVIVSEYRGADGSEVAIADDKCILYPVGVQGNLVHATAPMDEKFAFVNTPGKKTYVFTELDPRTPAQNKEWVKVIARAYPLMYVARPKTLGRGKM